MYREKINKDYFDSVENGSKKYELRLNDFEVHEGDVLILKEWDTDKKEYTGRSLEKNVTCVNRFSLETLESFWKKEEIDTYGLQIISIE